MARALHERRDTDDDAAEAALREEARRLAADPTDRAELAELCKELDELTPAWPVD
jgi:hypothetical protein